MFIKRGRDLRDLFETKLIKTAGSYLQKKLSSELSICTFSDTSQQYTHTIHQITVMYCNI